MGTALGLLGILGWIVSVTALAAGITYVVVRLTPGEKKPREPDYAPTSES